MVLHNNPENTTILIKKETKKKLDDLKIISRESYDAVINRILTNFSS